MSIRQVLRRLTLQDPVKRARKRYGKAEDVTIELDNLGGITRLAYWSSEISFPRISVPVEIMTMSGALPYVNSCNPFVVGLTEGREALAAFYDRFQPKSLAERYRIDAPDELEGDFRAFRFPWVDPVSKAPRGESGLGPEHGFSTFGPVAPEKLSLEMRRLETARAAIEKEGYRPDIYGDISGFFLRNGDDFRFVVRGGKHRAAVLVARGDRHVPVRMKRGWPRFIDRRTVADWPAVAGGDMSEAFALAFFDAHFDYPSFEDLAGS